MKQFKLILIILILSSSFLHSQIDSISIRIINDSTLTESLIMTDDQGKVVNENITYYLIKDFISDKFSSYEDQLIQIEEREKVLTRQKRQNRDLRKFLEKVLKADYNMFITDKYKTLFLGEGILKIDNKIYRINTTNLKSNKKKLKVRGEGLKNTFIKILHRNKIELLTNSETVILTKRNKDIYKGRLNNVKYIFRKLK